MLPNDHISQLAFAYGLPPGTGVIKTQPQDFQVRETLSFDLQNQGDHAYILILKQNLNTITVAEKIARLANVKLVAVGFAGLKDKYALTSQWFSVDLSGKPEPDWTQLEDQELNILKVTRHTRKLRRGAIKSNRFNIVVKTLQGDKQSISEKLATIQNESVPNYFGRQRFGHREQNVQQALVLFSNKRAVKNRHKRGLYLSAARALLFNHVLSHRVKSQTWQTPVEGDVMILEGTHSFFCVDKIDDDLKQRVRLLDIHPSGPLFGKGVLASKANARTIEHNILAAFPEFTSGLEQFGLKQDRRSLRLPVLKLEWQFVFQDSLELTFDLKPGGYATSVLRELINCA